MAIAFPLFAYAQQRINIPIICAEPAFVQKILKEHKEEILFVGRDTIHNVENLAVNIFLNSVTGTYSIVLVTPDEKMVCVIGSGEKGKLIYNN